MRKALENFWYYHKWKVFVAIMVLMVVFNTVSELTAMDDFDYSVGVVTMEDVSDQACRELADAFSQVFPDANEDGTVQVQVNVYHYGIGQDITPMSLTEDDAVHLSADVQVGMSCVFLTDSPEVFADSGLIPMGPLEDYPVLEPLQKDFSSFVLFTPDPVAGFVMEALG